MGCRIAMWLCYWEHPLPKLSLVNASGLPLLLGAVSRKRLAIVSFDINIDK
jgi:hypothetical protein